ncbi:MULTISPECIES: hypothetical protein [Bacillus]|uniref:Uncharacterized protein n=2 Tax=Bacillus thuringiensis TaxID=1428 RepID=A0AAP4Q6Q9_BACTU|nr:MULTISPECIES: hypothetical protein [Bacillus]MEC0048483.1 hypothetical protein [Bacillus cereus]AFV21951.1 hypothetical protein BTB_502p06460 [Bacillus thuringiensis Bt407]ERI00871.1 hypothetical protein BTCBT_002426 [Bacillus thuringiensis T01-328]MBN6707644.1 hypothetical protein [Bacillus thuringiensis]MDN7078528.1 hypothetical protein [Bacillus thuringiensis]
MKEVIVDTKKLINLSMEELDELLRNEKYTEDALRELAKRFIFITKELETALELEKERTKRLRNRVDDLMNDVEELEEELPPYKR